MAYTYNDFLKAANSSGVLQRFSDNDLTVAQKNPEYGLSMVSLMKDISGAKTMEQRMLATEAAKQLRKNYGASGYTDTADALMGKIQNYGSFNYDGQSDYQKLLNQVAGYGDFQYDRNPEYQQTLDKLGSFGDFQYGKQEEYQKLLDQVSQYGSFQFAQDTSLQETLEKLKRYGAFQYSKEDALEQAQNKVNQYAPYQYGNQNEYQKLLEDVLNQKDFHYDAAADPSFSAYKKAYLREGERASANALAQASAASGGRPSSYAVGAAQQAGNYYAGQLSDIIPTLEENAYNRYIQNMNAKLSGLNVLQSDRAFDYQKYLDAYSQLQNTLANLQGDRAYEQENWLNQYNMLQNTLGNLQGERNFDYQKFLDMFNRLQSGLGALEGDRAYEQENWLNQYNMLQNLLSNLQSDRNFDYQGYLDQFNQLQSSLGALEGDRAFDYENWMDEYNMLQNSLGNAQNMAATEYQKYLDAYEQQMQADQLAYQKELDGQALQQQEFENALALYQLLGYATPEVAKILGIQSGNGGAGSQGSSGSTGRGSGPQTVPSTQPEEPSNPGPQQNEYIVDEKSVAALGYGDLTEEKLGKLIEDGYVEMYYDGNWIRFRKTGKEEPKQQTPHRQPVYAGGFRNDKRTMTQVN